MTFRPAPHNGCPPSFALTRRLLYFRCLALASSGFAALQFLIRIRPFSRRSAACSGVSASCRFFSRMRFFSRSFASSSEVSDALRFLLVARVSSHRLTASLASHSANAMSFFAWRPLAWPGTRRAPAWRARALRCASAWLHRPPPRLSRHQSLPPPWVAAPPERCHRFAKPIYLGPQRRHVLSQPFTNRSRHRFASARNGPVGPHRRDRGGATGSRRRFHRITFHGERWL
ncbi:MAG: hypothetical protein USCAAHI_01937 [Beijerinckiaceae bacterium]|nr:MAG: hypothetical protein USCAAHI_01937 [Beijerinckiaceae bacterium]